MCLLRVRPLEDKLVIRRDNDNTKNLFVLKEKRSVFFVLDITL